MKYKLKSIIDKQNILEQICDIRGIDYNKLDGFLNPTLDEIKSPLMYENMDKACKQIIQAIETNKKIGVLIDSDTDGFCSSAVIVGYIMKTFGFTNFMFFMHDDKKHGLTPPIMNSISNSDIDFLIIPDAGSHDLKQHKILKDKGIEIVVIDHHEFDKMSKDATVVSNQWGYFGNKTLSGGGMVMKVIEHIDKLTNNNNALYFTDLVAVALVGDIMLMTQPETRFYVLHGLRNINNPLLEELYRGDKARTFETISFDIAPTINAFIRVGSREEREDLFCALIGNTDPRQISIRGKGELTLKLNEYIGAMASRIKSRQASIIKSAVESEKTTVIHEGLPIAICLLDDEAPRGLTGLIANRLVEIYKKPAIVLKDEGNKFGGSGRTKDTFPLFKDFINELSIFDYALGHQGAFGVGIKKDKFGEMLEILQNIKIEDELDVHYVDKAYHNIVSAYDIMAVSDLEYHWSRGFEKPSFYIKIDNCNDLQLDIIGQKRDTIRIKHNYITYIKFKCEPEEIEMVKNLMSVQEVEIIGSFAVNEWNDRLFPQVHIEELEIKGIKFQPVINNVNPFTGFGADFTGFAW